MVFEKIYAAIRMSYLYQINCELTPEQSKLLLDFIDNVVIVTDSGERIGVTGVIATDAQKDGE